MDGPVKQDLEVYSPPEDLRVQAHIKSIEEYKALYHESLNNPQVIPISPPTPLLLSIKIILNLYFVL